MQERVVHCSAIDADDVRVRTRNRTRGAEGTSPKTNCEKRDSRNERNPFIFGTRVNSRTHHVAAGRARTYDVGASELINQRSTSGADHFAAQGLCSLHRKRFCVMPHSNADRVCSSTCSPTAQATRATLPLFLAKVSRARMPPLCLGDPRRKLYSIINVSRRTFGRKVS